MIDLILADTFYNVRREPGSQIPELKSFSEDGIPGMMKMEGKYLELEGHAHMFCSVIKFSIWIETISTSAGTLAFQDSEGNKQKRKEARFNQGI